MPDYLSSIPLPDQLSGWLRLALLFSIAVATLCYQYRQNVTLYHQSAPALRQLARRRGLYIVLALFALIAISAGYEFRHQHTHAQLANLLHQMQLPPPVPSLPQSESEPASQSQSQSASESGLDTPPSTKPATPTDDSSEQHALLLDSLKQEFEDLFINYHILQHCGLATPQDYRLMHTALTRRLHSLNAPADMQQNILNAAHGSFIELYSRRDCTDASTATTHRHIQHYLQTLSAPHPPAE